MSDRIFYSWQSGCPSNTNRNFILAALEKAIEEIHKDESTDVEAVIDRDTLGLAGSPDISQSIFTKIDMASVFVCDVTIIDSNRCPCSRPTAPPAVPVWPFAASAPIPSNCGWGCWGFRAWSGCE